MSDREAFLAGDRPDDIWMFLSDAVTDADRLAAVGERVDGGVVLVVDGERGRGAFREVAGVDPMTFAGRAMDTDGDVDPDCTGGTCPARGRAGDHSARFVFAFVQEQNPEAGELYAEGDVVHAYVSCSCGQAYSDKWVASER